MKSAGAVKLADLTELTPKLVPAEGETLIVLTDKPCRTLKCVFSVHSLAFRWSKRAGLRG